MQHKQKILALMLPCILLSHGASAKESIEFVAEHVAEIAMDNRFASLPLWNACSQEQRADRTYCFGINASYARTDSGTLTLDGPMFSLSAARPLGEHHRWVGFVFFDDFSLSGGEEHRPLDTLFVDAPLTQPAEAVFTGLNGRARDVGLGLALKGTAHWNWLPWCEWSAGLMWQQFKLTDYRFDYLITEGPDAGTAGTIDFSATYTHIAPILGAAWPRARGSWQLVPHVQLAVPLPRRGIEGRITGPGFDLSGNSGDNGTGTPFGDPSVTIGLNVTYQPWNFTVDIGSTITQALIEPKIHEGVQQNVLLTAHWTF
jgi:hypothetical protein